MRSGLNEAALRLGSATQPTDAEHKALCMDLRLRMKEAKAWLKVKCEPLNSNTRKRWMKKACQDVRPKI